ncbi:haloacid dehalogenase [Marinobacterium nitratireducens]|uniref:Haloacid dehalogenase n=2 Tax=Marinobacterium nitratireducens TaxID=518897 RepID=A0A918DQ28_9GAMM|nr:haloacid dehalogenase [Marinobacterium nitratireducens]
MSLHAILFDHDGTLVDSEATHLQLWRQVVAPFGVEIRERDYWEQMLGVPVERNAADLIRIYGIDAGATELVQAKLEANERFLRDSCFPAMPGASRILQSLAGQVRLGLVSGSQRNCVEASLRGHGWQTLFEQVVTGDDVSRNKPRPDGYLKALEQMRLEASDCLAVEDTEVGVRAARAAGLQVIAIRSPLAGSHDFSAASAVVDSLEGAHDWIRTEYKEISS